MSIVATLFSFKGRISRLRFFLASMLASFVPILVLVAALIGGYGVGVTSGWSANAGAHSTLALALIGILAALVLAGWMNFALAWKRANDAGLGPVFKWGYVACYVGYVVPLVNIVAIIAQAVMWWTLVLKRGSEDGARFDVAAFGPDASAAYDPPANPSFGTGPATGLAALTSEDAMRRRAAELAAPRPAAHAPGKPHARPRAGGTPSGFGRRTQPAFGKR